MMMKAGVVYAVNDLRVSEVPKPVPKQDEVLVKVQYCGVCGSDSARVYGTALYHYPTVIGHEFAGVVAEDAQGELVGKKVAIFPLLPCFACEECARKSYVTCKNYDYYGSRRDGGFAEYIAVKRWNLIVLPDDMDCKLGAMCEPVSIAKHASDRLQISGGENVLVTGAGPIGILVGLWLKKKGVKQVYYTDLDARKLTFAKEIGFADYAETNGLAMDCAVEGTGCSTPLETCLQAVKAGGQLVCLGNPHADIALSRNAYWCILRKELTVRGTWNSSYNDIVNDWKASIQAIASGEIQPAFLISHVYPLNKINDAFEMIKGKQEFYNKVLIDCGVEV